jgi:hypothetical protein
LSSEWDRDKSDTTTITANQTFGHILASDGTRTSVASRETKERKYWKDTHPGPFTRPWIAVDREVRRADEFGLEKQRSEECKMVKVPTKDNFVRLKGHIICEHCARRAAGEFEGIKLRKRRREGGAMTLKIKDDGSDGTRTSVASRETRERKYWKDTHPGPFTHPWVAVDREVRRAHEFGLEEQKCEECGVVKIPTKDNFVKLREHVICEHCARRAARHFEGIKLRGRRREGGSKIPKIIDDGCSDGNLLTNIGSPPDRFYGSSQAKKKLYPRNRQQWKVHEMQRTYQQ